MSNDRTILSGEELEPEDLTDWRLLFSTLHARFRTDDFATGLALVARIGAAAEEADHHPDVVLAYSRVDVRLTSHDVGGVTQRDVRLARLISDMAAQLGGRSDPASLSTIELALDTPDLAEVRPFWAAVLGYDLVEDPVDEIVDPEGVHPTIWFQESAAHEVSDQRWHLDIRVPPEVAEGRVQAALDAGGTLVDDTVAPTFWVLADAQGNRACVCTWAGRTA